MSLKTSNDSGHNISDEAQLPTSPSIALDISECGWARAVRSASISLSTGPTATGLSFTLDLDQEESIVQSSSLHEDIEKLFDDAPEITLSDLLSSGAECIPSDRGIVVADITVPTSDGRVLEEYDITSHRRSSFPHIHVPLKSLHSHSLKNLADEEVAEKRERKKKKHSAKKSKKTKSIIFPSKSALLSPVIHEVEKEEYSECDNEEEQNEDDNDDEGDGDTDDGEDENDETTKLLGGINDEDSATSGNIDNKEMTKPVQLLEATNTYQSDQRHTNKELPDMGHIHLPWIIGGEMDGSRTDLSEHQGQFYIGSKPRSSTHAEPASIESLSQNTLALSFSTPLVVVLDSTGKPVVSISSKEAGESTAIPMVNTYQDTYPVTKDDRSAVKFLVGKDLDDTSDYEYKHVPDDNFDDDSDEDDSDIEDEEDDDCEREDDAASEGKDEDYENAPLFLTPTSWQVDRKDEQKSMRAVASTPRSKFKSHHRHQKYGTKDLLRRRQRGSEVQMSDELRRSPTEIDEALTLQSVDLDEMASHRMENLQGLHMHKIVRTKHKTSSYIGKADKIRKKIFKPKKTFDHTPHEVFVELDELYTQDGFEVEWREKARWIKFEEDVEEGAERWGKPHVASLSFHSLLELRRLLEAGSLLFDVEVSDFLELIHKICENMLIHDQIPSESKGLVMRTLLTKHKFVGTDMVKLLMKRNKSSIDLLDFEQRCEL